MKWFYLSFLFILFFTGCSTTYTTKYYESKEYFIKDINNSIDDTPIKVTLLQGDEIAVEDGGAIKNDTLFTAVKFYPLSTLKSIAYRNKTKSTVYGTCLGGITALVVGAQVPNTREGAYNYFFIGLIPGAIVGYLIKWDDIYEFQ